MRRPKESPPVSLGVSVCNHVLRHGDGRQGETETGKFGDMI